MRVSDIMTVSVACCGPDVLLPDVAQLMCDNDCGAIPVLDHQKRPLGVVTDRDMVCRAIALRKEVRGVAAREVMSKPVITVSPSTSIDECCRVLEKNQIRRVVVVDDVGACCGIIAQADIARHAPKQEVGEVVQAVSKATAGREVGAWFA